MASTSELMLVVTAYGGGKDYTKKYTGSNASSPVAVDPAHAFSTGFNTLAVPTSANTLVISNITGTLTLKGINGDTGYGLSSTNFPVVLNVTGGGTVPLNATAGATADLDWY